MNNQKHQKFSYLKKMIQQLISNPHPNKRKIRNKRKIDFSLTNLKIKHPSCQIKAPQTHLKIKQLIQNQWFNFNLKLSKQFKTNLLTK